jgi:cold shock CspA family protein
MGKSQETWNKKEKEKIRQRKKNDKAQKKEDRKANATTGSSLEEMFAYVDENGNLTTTPPDPKKKKIIKESDIVLGVPKQEDMIPVDVVRKGIVSFFNDSKGYGFIKDLETQDSVFVHLNGLIDSIKEGNKVTFEVEQSPKGFNAIKVQLDK